MTFLGQRNLSAAQKITQCISVRVSTNSFDKDLACTAAITQYKRYSSWKEGEHLRLIGSGCAISPLSLDPTCELEYLAADGEVEYQGIEFRGSEFVGVQ